MWLVHLGYIAALCLIPVVPVVASRTNGVGASYSPPPLQEERPFSMYDAGLFTPFEDLHALPSEGFSTLRHPAFPRHSVRVKKSRFCDGSVAAYTGYIDIEARHLFFYFFESRGNPKTDDVVLWTNGGPGSSSSMGLFMELGPCRVTSANSTEPFPYSWNEHANIFFIDQPVGVGFSYAEYGEYVDNTLDAGDDVAAFMVVFFEHFTQFKGRPVHLTGESYAGRYLPVFASKVYDQNSRLVDSGMSPINLASVMIGNGCTDWATMNPAYYYTQCEDPLMAPIVDIAGCVQMKQKLPRCEKRYKESCVDRYDHIDCLSAQEFCFESLWGFFKDRNAYDRTRLCKGHPETNQCYPIAQAIDDYLSDNRTQAFLGVDPPARGRFTPYNAAVGLMFTNSGDLMRIPAQDYLAALLERGVPVLLYAGETDFACNWIGVRDMALALEWSGNEDFRSSESRPWTVEGQKAGVVRSGGGLTFATVAGAGHLVPYDKPVEAFAMAGRWLRKEAL